MNAVTNIIYKRETTYVEYSKIVNIIIWNIENIKVISAMAYLFLG